MISNHFEQYRLNNQRRVSVLTCRQEERKGGNRVPQIRKAKSCGSLHCGCHGCCSFDPTSCLESSNIMPTLPLTSARLACNESGKQFAVLMMLCHLCTQAARRKVFLSSDDTQSGRWCCFGYEILGAELGLAD